MQEAGKWLVIIGMVIAALGALIWSGVGKGWLGQMPGDIQVHRPNFTLHFPVVTCLVLSVVLSLALWLFRR